MGAGRIWEKKTNGIADTSPEAFTRRANQPGFVFVNTNFANAAVSGVL